MHNIWDIHVKPRLLLIPVHDEIIRKFLYFRMNLLLLLANSGFALASCAQCNLQMPHKVTSLC